jgi:molecular chaperone GrpE
MTDESNAPDATPAPAPADGDVPPTAADTPDLAAITDARDRYYDLLLRKTAEFDNYRKRVERERLAWAEGAVGDVVTDLLPVIDDLERALKIDASGEQADAYRRGVELILKRLLDTLKRRGVTAVDAVGQSFDPHRHQAVTYEPAEGKADGEIIEEYARGYLLGDRLLRPAMVKVAKA